MLSRPATARLTTAASSAVASSTSRISLDAPHIIPAAVIAASATGARQSRAATRSVHSSSSSSSTRERPRSPVRRPWASRRSAGIAWKSASTHAPSGAPPGASFSPAHVNFGRPGTATTAAATTRATMLPTQLTNRLSHPLPDLWQPPLNSVHIPRHIAEMSISVPNAETQEKYPIGDSLSVNFYCNRYLFNVVATLAPYFLSAAGLHGDLSFASFENWVTTSNPSRAIMYNGHVALCLTPKDVGSIRADELPSATAGNGSSASLQGSISDGTMSILRQGLGQLNNPPTKTSRWAVFYDHVSLLGLKAAEVGQSSSSPLEYVLVQELEKSTEERWVETDENHVATLLRMVIDSCLALERIPPTRGPTL